jgi:hypothetical protein
MTRFDYFSDIEDHFIRLRGKALFLDSLDWELIEQWKTAGVPLHVVISAIDEVFEKSRARANRRAIGTLRYCKPEVEARFAEWKESRVGAHESEPGAVATGSTDRSPFPKDEVIAYLRRICDELLTLDDAPDGLKIAILHVTEKLRGIVTGLHATDRVNAPMMEDALGILEAILNAAIEMVATPEQRAEARAAAAALFGPYKDEMPENVYERQIDDHLKKHLRKIFGVPRLSLFHMK